VPSVANCVSLSSGFAFGVRCTGMRGDTRSVFAAYWFERGIRVHAADAQHDAVVHAREAANESDFSAESSTASSGGAFGTIAHGWFVGTVGAGPALGATSGSAMIPLPSANCGCASSQRSPPPPVVMPPP